VTAASRIVVLGLGVEVLDLPGPQCVPPLVLLHEGLGSVGLWRSFPAALQAATGRRVIAFSRYGHGLSGRPRAQRTPAFFEEEAVDVLPALLAELGADEPVLVGHSDGGSIALIYAAEHDVSALVLVAPHVFVEEVTVNAIRDTREEYVNGALRERMARHHDDPDAAFWGWCDVWLDPAFRTWDLREHAQRLTAPTLLIQGADDPYGSLEQLDRIEAAAQGTVRRVVLPGGHSPHIEHEQDVVSAVSDFLAHHQDPTRTPGPGSTAASSGWTRDARSAHSRRRKR
jgi:pimeloyl-ACP methyl ester carboxylesterase